MKDLLDIHFGYHDWQRAKTAADAFEDDSARAWGGARVGQEHGGAGGAGCNTDSKSDRTGYQVFAHRGIQEEREKKEMTELNIPEIRAAFVEGKKKFYGGGNKYRRGRIWWIKYSRSGHAIRESTGTTDERKAEQLLRKRLEEIKKPDFVGPAERKLTLENLERKLEADYIRHGRRSLKTVKFCLATVKKQFSFDRLIDITPTKIEAYQQERLDAGMARATVNREIRYLLHGYRLLFNAGEISYIPRVKLLENENVREGFINRPEFDALCEHLDEDNRDIVKFLYLSAWRSGEAKSLEWSKLDERDLIIRLSRKNEKTKRPRTLALVGELREIIERRQQKRLPFCQWVFHRNGKQIKSFSRAFKAAAKSAGLEGLLPHDLRRSGIRNFSKAGLGESEGMSISGHKTNSVYKRYNIIDENLQRQALERANEFQKQEVAKRKVVPIRQVG